MSVVICLVEQYETSQNPDCFRSNSCEASTVILMVFLSAASNTFSAYKSYVACIFKNTLISLQQLHQDTKK